jgi:hypothetical protein
MKFQIDDGNGVIQEFHLDADKKGNVVINSMLKEDVSEILQDNKQQQSFGKQTLGKGTQTSMYKLGQISNMQAYMLIQQGIFQDDKALRKWFEDLDNYYWRTVDKSRRGGQKCRTESTKPSMIEGTTPAGSSSQTEGGVTLSK